MRRQLDALQAQQAQSEKIVDFEVVRGNVGFLGDFHRTISEKLQQGFVPFGAPFCQAQSQYIFQLMVKHHQ